MDDINRINSTKLAEYLDAWFKQSDVTDDRFWRRNPAAIIIKNHLNELGKWRYKARGNPKKGWAAYLKKVEEDKLDLF